MLLKVFLNLGVLFILFSCSTGKVIKLSPAKGASREFGSRSLFTEVIIADSAQAAFARQINLDSFWVGRLNYYPTSYTIYGSKAPVPNSDPQESSQRHNQLVSDTTVDIPFENFETDILFLYGKKADGKYIVVSDANNNNSFQDDSAYVFDQINTNQIVSTVGLDSFPHIKIDNVKSYYNKKIQTFTHHLVIEPILSYHNDDQNSKEALILRVVSIEYKTGSFHYKGERYKVAVRNTLLPYLYYDPRAIKIKFAKASDTSAFQKTGGRQPTYFIGDTVLLDKRQFKIRKVSPLLNKIKITPLRKTVLSSED